MVVTPTEITLPTCVKGDMPLHLAVHVVVFDGPGCILACVVHSAGGVRLALHRTLTLSKRATCSFAVIVLLVVALWARTPSPTLLSVASCHHHLSRRWPARLGENGHLMQ